VHVEGVDEFGVQRSLGLQGPPGVVGQLGGPQREFRAAV
jgi:hypothetical protein